MTGEQGWYSDRELFEMINGLKLELVKTQEHIKKYNGLLEKFEDVDDRIKAIEQQSKGKSAFAKSIREWGGWAVGLAGVGLALWRK